VLQHKEKPNYRLICSAWYSSHGSSYSALKAPVTARRGCYIPLLAGPNRSRLGAFLKFVYFRILTIFKKNNFENWNKFLKMEQFLNWNKFQKGTNLEIRKKFKNRTTFKLEQILKLEQISKLEQITNWNEFQI
jgi:hypothetical protein